MSDNRPIGRLVIKDTNTEPYTFKDVATIWPNRFEPEDESKPKGVSLGNKSNNPDYNVTPQEALDMLERTFTEKGVYLELRPPFERRDNDDF